IRRGSSACAAGLPVCSTSRGRAWRNIWLSSGGIGARSVRTYRNDLVWLSGNADVEVLQPRRASPTRAIFPVSLCIQALELIRHGAALEIGAVAITVDSFIYSVECGGLA